MPSCDGSNCGACSACTTKTKYVHLDKEEKRKLERKIDELKAELANEQKINRQLVERLLEEKRI